MQAVRRLHVTTNNDYVPGERLESGSIRLFDRNRNMAGFSGLNIMYSASFSFMRSADHFASSAVSELACCFRSHAEKYSQPSFKPETDQKVESCSPSYHRFSVKTRLIELRTSIDSLQEI
jgi:hypothetical protein